MIKPENEFEEEIVKFCMEIADMLIGKNRKYGDSFRRSRQDTAKEFGNPRIPLWLHIVEKLRRYMANKPDEDEDIVKDGAGYFILEAVCARFDDIQRSQKQRADGQKDTKL